MRGLAALLVAVSLVVPAFAGASADKQLQNEKGEVSYAHGSGASHKLAHTASIVLEDKDVAITGNASLAAVMLPDSSRVTMGSDTRVEMAFFNQAESTSAKFIVYDGKTRFKIEHPNGRPANYTFVTPTASIAVRGTEGDIAVDGKNLTVNVYGLSDPKLPVVVTLKNGKRFILRAGQQLLAQWINGQIQTSVDALTQQALAQFQELGAPVSNWAAAVAALPGASAITNNVPGGGLLGGLFGHRAAKPQAAGSPGPTPTPCLQTAAPARNVIGFLRRAVSAATPAPCVSPSATP